MCMLRLLFHLISPEEEGSRSSLSELPVLVFLLVITVVVAIATRQVIIIGKEETEGSTWMKGISATWSMIAAHTGIGIAVIAVITNATTDMIIMIVGMDMAADTEKDMAEGTTAIGMMINLPCLPNTNE